MLRRLYWRIRGHRYWERRGQTWHVTRRHLFKLPEELEIDDQVELTPSDTVSLR